METLAYSEKLVRQTSVDGHGMATMLCRAGIMVYFTCTFMGTTGWGRTPEDAEESALQRATRLGVYPENYIPEMSGIKPTPLALPR